MNWWQCHRQRRGLRLRQEGVNSSQEGFRPSSEALSLMSLLPFRFERHFVTLIWCVKNVAQVFSRFFRSKRKAAASSSCVRGISRWAGTNDLLWLKAIRLNSNEGSMNARTLFMSLLIGIVSISCTKRDFNTDFDKAESMKETEIEQNGYNAFLLWRGGTSVPLFKLPSTYHLRLLSTKSDDVFYLSRSEFWSRKSDGTYTAASPTVGTSIDGRTLVYPTKEQRVLRIKFEDPLESDMTHDESVASCKMQGLRLPTIRELFDFCVAGLEQSTTGKYPAHRCPSERFFWSATLDSENSTYAWSFGGHGSVGTDDRYVRGQVRCVGQAKQVAKQSD